MGAGGSLSAGTLSLGAGTLSLGAGTLRVPGKGRRWCGVNLIMANSPQLGLATGVGSGPAVVANVGQRRQKIIWDRNGVSRYLCTGKVLYDQLPLNPARAGRQQR